MRAVVTLCAATMLLAWTASAGADDCPGNPDALGTQRVITVDPTEHPRIGTVQYSESLPLNDKEVVLSFDDGPVMVYTDRILETLSAPLLADGEHRRRCIEGRPPRVAVWIDCGMPVRSFSCLELGSSGCLPNYREISPLQSITSSTCVRCLFAPTQRVGPAKSADGSRRTMHDFAATFARSVLTRT